MRRMVNCKPSDSKSGAHSTRSTHCRSSIHRYPLHWRLDPEKRVDLLLEALEGKPDSQRFEIRIFGTGWQTDELKARAARSGLNVIFEGFSSSVREALAGSDLLVHLCPVEPFGLAIIEAMAACVPVLAPDAGGAGSLIEDGGRAK